MYWMLCLDDPETSNQFLNRILMHDARKYSACKGSLWHCGQRGGAPYCHLGTFLCKLVQEPQQTGTLLGGFALNKPRGEGGFFGIAEWQDCQRLFSDGMGDPLVR